jgi:putative SOS response-associated peptidase YedK
MCNDFRLKAKLEYLIETFSQTRIPLKFPGGLPNIEPRDDIRITDRTPIVRAGDDGPVLEVMRWSWPGPTGKPVFNYRSEGRRFGVGRCLILADGFYEFTGDKSPKAKWLFTVADAPLFAIAGYIRNDAFTMLTCEPGPDIRPYHDRQVAILRPDQWAGWLSHAENEAELLRPLAAGALNVERAA